MTPIFRKILSPIQFNDPNSLAGLDLAQRLASPTKARIFLLHVMPSTLIIPDLPGYCDLFATDEGAVRQELEKLAATHLRDVVYEIVVKTGDPATMIQLVAQELGTDVIIMPTHGRRGLSHFFMGSVAEKVVREAPCMVLTIRPELVQKN